METRAFAPLYIKANPGVSNGTLIPSVTISASTTHAEGVLPAGGTNQIVVNNQSGSWAYLNFGIAGSVTAATAAAGFPVPPGLFRVLSLDSEVTGVSVILASGTGSVTFTRGEGVSI